MDIPNPNGRDPFTDVTNDIVLDAWLNMVVNYILPAISRAEPNPHNSQGLWKIIKGFPYQRRFAVYGEWKNRLYNDIPEMQLVRAACEKDCKYILG